MTEAPAKRFTYLEHDILRRRHLKRELERYVAAAVTTNSARQKKKKPSCVFRLKPVEKCQQHSTGTGGAKTMKHVDCEG